jgi:DNA-binding NarL/FixJ family response regulator
VSVRTVEAHRASLMRKLDLHSLSELIYFAIRHRIVGI